jgi:hypothetical protein
LLSLHLCWCDLVQFLSLATCTGTKGINPRRWHTTNDVRQQKSQQAKSGGYRYPVLPNSSPSIAASSSTSSTSRTIRSRRPSQQGVTLPNNTMDPLSSMPEDDINQALNNGEINRNGSGAITLNTSTSTSKLSGTPLKSSPRGIAASSSSASIIATTNDPILGVLNRAQAASSLTSS